MNKKDIATKLILDEFGVGFEDYQRCKNTIYLAQVKGICPNLFSFRWYVKGIYSSASDDFTTQLPDTYNEILSNEISKEIFDETAGWHLDKETSEKIKELKPLINSAKDLGLLASTHFLIDRSRIKSKREILKTLKEFKHTIPDNFELEIISHLIQYDLVKEQELTN